MMKIQARCLWLPTDAVLTIRFFLMTDSADFTGKPDSCPYEKLGKSLRGVMNKQNGHLYEFGDFQLDPMQRILFHHGERVRLEPKAIETLLALLEQPGQVMRKEDLMERIWPDTFVEEISLTKNISLLRKTLRNGNGAGKFIETIPTVGYRFVAEVQQATNGNGQATKIAAPEPTTLPEPKAAAAEIIERVEPAAEVLILAPVPTKKRWLWLVGIAVLLSCTAGALYFRDKRASQAQQKSIAVMPFKNLSGDVEQEYFTDGLTEHLIQDLSRLKDFKVIARDSVFRFKGKPIDWREAGQQLNVAAILEGSIRRNDDRLQINVTLRSTEDGHVIWTSERDKPLADIIAIEKEIGCSVTANLQVVLCNDESSRIETNNIEAYLTYLKGLYQFNLRTGESLKKAINYFEEAVALDPNFAEGWAAVADAYYIGKWYIPLSHDAVTSKGSAAAREAWALDQKSAHACLMMAIYLSDSGQRDKAEAFDVQVLLLNPNYAYFSQSHGLYLSLIGHYDEGINLLKKAQQLDPLSLVVNTDVGYAYYIAHRYDEAIAAYRKALAMDQKFSLAHLLLGLALTQTDQHDEAITEVQRATDRGSEYLAALGNVYARAGKQAQAKAVLKELQQLARQGYVPPYQIAWVYCGLGDTEKALPLMQQSVEKNVGVIDFKHHPVYEPLLTDPRYQELLLKVKFPW